MCRDKDGRAKVIYLLQYLDDIVRVDGIKVPRGLIRDKHIRLIHDGSRDGDALLLAAGKL